MERNFGEDEVIWRERRTPVMERDRKIVYINLALIYETNQSLKLDPN